MTNPNCEYTLNIPAMMTLAEWAHSPDWDSSGLPAHRKAARELLAETEVESYRTGCKVGEVRLDRDLEDRLTEADVDLICQMFWLPHSHGPKIVSLLENFQFCKENAAAIRGWKEFEASFKMLPHLNVNNIFQPGEQPDFVDIWIEKASQVNKICKDFFMVCDKMTHIRNRDLLFDLNSYLNNVRVILHACNNYLKWVGLDNCRKPLRCGPSLAGLPGGLAGELGRLYPIQSESQFPLRRPVTPASSALLVLPYRLAGNKYRQER